MLRADERGLSTLEWILLVAAVGGLATIGVIVVRGAVNETDDRTQTSASNAGEAGELKVLQKRVNELMFRTRTILVWGSDKDRHLMCLGQPKRPDGNNLAKNMSTVAKQIGELRNLHRELYTFHPVSVAPATANKFRNSNSGDPSYVWCRVRSKVSGMCASIAGETPVSDPPNDGYVDIANYRDRTIRREFPAHQNNPSDPHGRPLSNTLCNGRV